jgi:hypothetical protein
MDTSKIDIDARFTDGELFGMFNVECAPSWAGPNCLRLPLLKVKVKKVKKVKASKRMQKTPCDKIKDGVTTHQPGKARVDDLVAFYAANAAAEISPFEV